MEQRSKSIVATSADARIKLGLEVQEYVTDMEQSTCYAVSSRLMSQAWSIRKIKKEAMQY